MIFNSRSKRVGTTAFAALLVAGAATVSAQTALTVNGVDIDSDGPARSQGEHDLGVVIRLELGVAEDVGRWLHAGVARLVQGTVA